MRGLGDEGDKIDEGAFGSVSDAVPIVLGVDAVEILEASVDPAVDPKLSSFSLTGESPGVEKDTFRLSTGFTVDQEEFREWL